nr:MAG TPA: hypothetical protein [Caudoviricetes sp.]
MGRFVLTCASYPCEPSQANPSLGTPDTLPHCLLTYSYKGYAGRVYICCSVNIKATIKANRVITVTAIAGNSYYHSAC